VFQAEVTAILRCTEILLSKNVTRRRTYICSDSSRAPKGAPAKTTTELALVWDSMQALEKLNGFKKVTLVWIPGNVEHREMKTLINWHWPRKEHGVPSN
jgi:hypothetical protein